MLFRILGPLKLELPEGSHSFTAPKVRNLLALLLFRANSIVSVDSLIEELWSDAPPRSAVPTAQTYIYQMRKLFERELPAHGRNILETVHPGYILNVTEDQLDVARFTRLARQGRDRLDAGYPEQARDVLAQALSLWKGRALANVVPGPLLQNHLVWLEEERMQAIETRIRADLLLNRHRELVPELRSLVALYPMNEWFYGKLIQALARSGRRSEALQTYQTLRAVLNRELGLEPSQELRQVQQEVLVADV
ncbi:AfsR/SARP family transcriptional regulator [Actinomadura kijaniata]|uniref:AfsR/SARP family transcriptional regulator n=1 Tax=Actinomadura kijaniata TaxID=46161 RepID=UPI003F1D6ACC